MNRLQITRANWHHRSWRTADTSTIHWIPELQTRHSLRGTSQHENEFQRLKSPSTTVLPRIPERKQTAQTKVRRSNVHSWFSTIAFRTERKDTSRIHVVAEHTRDDFISDDLLTLTESGQYKWIFSTVKLNIHYGHVSWLRDWSKWTDCHETWIGNRMSNHVEKKQISKLWWELVKIFTRTKEIMSSKKQNRQEYKYTCTWHRKEVSDSRYCDVRETRPNLHQKTNNHIVIWIIYIIVTDCISFFNSFETVLSFSTRTGSRCPRQFQISICQRIRSVSPLDWISMHVPFPKDDDFTSRSSEISVLTFDTYRRRSVVKSTVWNPRLGISWRHFPTYSSNSLSMQYEKTINTRKRLMLIGKEIHHLDLTIGICAYSFVQNCHIPTVV